MLLVSFHGGHAANASNNVHAYATDDWTLLTKTALGTQVALDELRALVCAHGYLYVVNGGKSTSNVLCFQRKAASQFDYVDTVIAATFSHHGHFETAIAHPFGLAFDDEAGNAYVSNQDTNVVAQVALSKHDKKGSLGTGCQSACLRRLYPGGSFLDGTFVASQVGDLPDVKPHATPVAADDGGLAVAIEGDKVQHSVRDVAVANGILFACDEPAGVVRMYELPDGCYRGASSALAAAPTHLVIESGSLYVVAGAYIYRSPLPTSRQAPVLAFTQITLSPPVPQGFKIGGISFNNDVVYVPFQAGTGGADGGAIYSFTVDGSTFSNGTQQAQTDDTPEFVVFLAG